MSEPNRIEQVLSLHPLTSDQSKAVLLRNKDILVTAGAGSGKTRTIVARYLTLLAEGIDLRKIATITFTEKATKEMLNRIRKDLITLQNNSNTIVDQDFWGNLSNQIDGSRIGTIHSLCAVIIRTHPAEAAIDPQFEVLDETKAKIFQQQAVDLVISNVLSDPSFLPVFEVIESKDFRKLLDLIIEKEISGTHSHRRTELSEMIFDYIKSHLYSEEIQTDIGELRKMEQDGSLESDAANAKEFIQEFLKLWIEVEEIVEKKEPLLLYEKLFNIRRNHLYTRKGPKKGSLAKTILSEIKTKYDHSIDPIIGGSEKDNGISIDLENNVEPISLLLDRVVQMIKESYQSIKNQNGVLDFNDLEEIAYQLSKQEKIQSYWQDQLSYFLVDEFQDTNKRQRDIILSLCGEGKGKLFFVGDAQQSIYRFRGAEVDVFVEMQNDIKNYDGELVLLDINFRSHQPILNAVDELLAPIYDIAHQTNKTFGIPYTKLNAHRQEYKGSIKTPYISFEIGLADDAEDARRIMAVSIANTLIEMKISNEITNWNEVALLFRATKGFQYYEDVFNESNIPFVTISGSGFYDRPEIRDILNLLLAIANPYDDNAILGLLRSPVFGLSEEDIYQLRIDNNSVKSIYASISNITNAKHFKNEKILWVKETIQVFQKLVNHVSVSDLLFKLINHTNYKSILLSDDRRMVRNVEKLLDDAYLSDTNKVSDFINYINFSKEKGVHEGEATVEAENRVQLMTIHKSKGLEFPIVILADAGRQKPSNSKPFVYDSNYGPIYKIGKESTNSIAYRFYHQDNIQKEENEFNRLLYVACTRAKDKLLISGHCTKNSPRGFLKKLGMENDKENGVILDRDLSHSKINFYDQIKDQQIFFEDTIDKSKESEASEFLIKALKEESIYDLFVTDESTRELNEKNQEAKEFGLIVHKALQLWIFPEDKNFEDFLNKSINESKTSIALNQSEIKNQISRLLENFRESPLYTEIESSQHKYHEFPYSIKNIGNGIIDLLYEKDNKIYIVDFKSDRIENQKELEEKNIEYQNQLMCYRDAVKKITKKIPTCRLCYLNYNDSIFVVDLDAMSTSLDESQVQNILEEEPIEGYELELPNGDILMCEFGFEKNQIAVFLREDDEDKTTFSELGWKTVYLDEINLETLLTDINEGSL